MEKVKQVKLGRTNIVCGELGMGCEGFSKVTEKEARDMIDLALSKGMNFIDLYASNPTVRENIGKAINGRREEIYIQGHLCTIWKDNQYKRTRDINETISSFEDLFAKLNTDYVDVGMIHYIDEEKDYQEVFNGEIIKYALKLKEEGKIKYIGISSHNPLVAKKAALSGIIDVIMFSVNPCYDLLPPSEDCDILWDPSSYEESKTNFDRDRLDFYEVCEKEGVAITVMKAFAGGDLLSDDLSPFKKAMTPTQCINYCLTRPGVKVVLAGFHNIEEEQKDLEYINATDNEKDFSNVLNNTQKFSFDGHCVYCGHCAPCPKAIEIATVNKYLDLCVAQGEVVETVLNHYDLLKHHASECVKCGLCEARCPFNVKIREKMVKAKEIFGK